MFATSLRAFSATVRSGSIRKASDSLGVAPSSVSRHIAVLEREIGTPLFDRQARGVRLTHAGELVADYAQSVLINYDTLRSDLNDLRGMQRRLLRIAMVESVSTTGPVAAACRYIEQHPGVTFDLKLLPAQSVVDAVRNDGCDIGLTFGVEPQHDIRSLARFREPIVALVSSSHPLAETGALDLAALADFPVAMPESTFGIRRIVDRAFSDIELRIVPVMTSNSFEMLREFAASGAGLSILPMRACRHHGLGDLRIISLKAPSMAEAHIEMIVLRERRMPRVLSKFVEVLIAEVERASNMLS